MSILLQTLPYHCANDVLKVLKSLHECIEMCHNLATQIFPAKSFERLNELAVVTLNWSLEFFSESVIDSSAQMNTVELSRSSNASPSTSRGKRFHDDTVSEPSSKYNRLSLDRSRNMKHEKKSNTSGECNVDGLVWE